MKKVFLSLIFIAAVSVGLCGVAFAAPFPFTDDMESGSTNWSLDAPWAVSDIDAHSASNALCDSPDGYYENNADISTTLASAIDLSASENPVLKFWHKYQLENDYDFGYVEVSTDNGTTWSTVASFTGTSGGQLQPQWVMDTVNLSAYKSENFLVRFRLNTDKTEVRDGWCIDDIAIAEQPHSVDLTISNPGTTSLDLVWTQNLDPADTFSAYKIYRSELPQVDFNSTLVATITEQDTTTFTDTTLTPGHTYFYRIYVVSTYELYEGSKTAAGTTLPGGVYSWGFETGSADWTFTGSWAVTDEDGYNSSGHCLTDSPGGTNYGNSVDQSATVSVDLGSAIRPVLSFYNRYGFESYHDFGWVEVSNDGGAHWQRLFFVTGSSNGQWIKNEIDLSEYSGQELEIRFRITSDNNGVTNDGWYVDDVQITENRTVIPYPFEDNFEEQNANWISSSWGRYSGDPHSGIWAMADSPEGNMADWVHNGLTLRGTLNLLAAASPRLSFWYKFDAAGEDYLCVYVSTDGGRNWTRLWQFGGYSDQNNWTRVELDLSPYRSSNVAIRFQVEDRNYGDGNGAWLDDILIDDAPSAVDLYEPADVEEHSLTLSWSASDAPDFLRYRLYRSTSSGITGQRAGDELVAETMDVNQTTFTDILDDPGQTYYYRIFVEDIHGLVSSGSNEVSATTLEADTGTYPYSDDMESGDRWSNSLPWQLTDEDAHSGSYCFTDSPDGNYANNIDRSMVKEIDLGSALRPVLSFWDKYSLESYHDFGWVEVSNDGGVHWQRRFFVTGTSSGQWLKEEIDLSEYAGQVIRVRFRLTSDDNGVTNDGWYIDDVEITENTATTPFPFVEDFEQGARANWLLSNWRDVSSSSAHDSSYAVTDSPKGVLGNAVYAGMTLRGTIDLIDVASPKLSFWYKFDASSEDYLCVYVSTDGGRDWIRLWQFGRYSDQNNWTRVELDLSPYRSSRVAIRFQVEDRNYGNGDGAWIDDVSITGAEGLISAMAVQPGSASVLSGSTLQFTATGYDDDGNAVSITPELIEWGVRGDIGVIDEHGVFTALNPGIGAITATYGGRVSDISGIIEVVQSAGATPQIEYGTVTLSDTTVPEDGKLYFKAYIRERPDEILTQHSQGCAYGSGAWQVNIGNFPTPWVPGEHLRVDFIDAGNGETGSVEYALTYGGQSHDVILSPISYSFVTTSSTNVNVITLVKDSGVTDAEGLAQVIPNALEISYWDALHQAYIGHSKGSPLMNFPVKAGYPYFVTVSAPGTWTPTGSVPDPWPEVDLVTTGTTNVNMVSLPLTMQRITKAEELGHVVRNCTEITRWDAENQGYVGHSYGTPLFNFDIDVLQPYFVTVTDDSTLSIKGLVSKGGCGGVPQIEGGNVYSQDGFLLDNVDVSFSAWIVGREDDVLTEESVGCGVGEGFWQINVGNFATPWHAGDVVHVEFSTPDGQTGTLEFVLGWMGSSDRDVYLSEDQVPLGADSDGDVDGVDLSILSRAYDCMSGEGCYNAFCDVNNNGHVDPDDLETFANHFGE